LQNPSTVRGPPYLYELMFDSKTKITNRLTDAADLLIDFATLGEYGLEEPVGRTRQGCVDLPAASPRKRPTAPTTRANARSAHCNPRRGIRPLPDPARPPRSAGLALH